MCHLLLALPLLALPVFWLMPLGAALATYGAVSGLAIVIYWYALLAMKRPVATGLEGMVGETGTVVETSGRDFLVQIHNELWRATARGPLLRPGNVVEVVGFKERTLYVCQVDPMQRFFPAGAGPGTPPRKGSAPG